MTRQCREVCWKTRTLPKLVRVEVGLLTSEGSVFRREQATIWGGSAFPSIHRDDSTQMYTAARPACVVPQGWRNRCSVAVEGSSALAASAPCPFTSRFSGVER